jgi:hypothetical protein
MAHSEGDISTPWTTQLAHCWVFVLFEQTSTLFHGRACEEVWTNYLHLGYLDHIIISNVEMAMEVLKILDAAFVYKPHMFVNKYVGFDWSNIAFAPYGDHWHLLCKICITKIFTKTKLKSFEPRHQTEMAYIVGNITKHNEEGKVVEIRHIFHKLTMNNIFQMFFGTRHENSNDI